MSCEHIVDLNKLNYNVTEIHKKVKLCIRINSSPGFRSDSLIVLKNKFIK